MSGFAIRAAGAVILVLRQLIRGRYVLLGALIVYTLFAIRPYFPVSDATYWTSSLGLLALFTLVDAMAATPKAPFYWNFLLSERQTRIAELLACCKKSLLVVSGEFSHETFNSEAVLNELRKLPADVRVELYVTAARVDPASTEFLSWAKQRGLTVRQVEDLAHRIVVDDLNVRIEFRDNGLVGKGRPAMLVYGDPSVAAYAREGLNRILTAGSKLVPLE